MFSVPILQALMFRALLAKQWMLQDLCPLPLQVAPLLSLPNDKLNHSYHRSVRHKLFETFWLNIVCSSPTQDLGH